MTVWPQVLLLLQAGDQLVRSAFDDNSSVVNEPAWRIWCEDEEGQPVRTYAVRRNGSFAWLVEIDDRGLEKLVGFPRVVGESPVERTFDSLLAEAIRRKAANPLRVELGQRSQLVQVARDGVNVVVAWLAQFFQKATPESHSGKDASGSDGAP